MALSNDELELQTTDYLPAREVMTGVCGWHGHGGGFVFQDGVINVNAQDIDVLKDINILTGKDNDLIDIL